MSRMMSFGAGQYSAANAGNGVVPFDRRYAVRDLADERRRLMRQRIAAAQRGDSAMADQLSIELRRIDDEGQSLTRSDESRYIRDPGEVAASRDRLRESAALAYRTSARNLTDRAGSELGSLERDREDRFVTLPENLTPTTGRDIARADRVRRLTAEAGRDAANAERPMEFPEYTPSAVGGGRDAALREQVMMRHALAQRAGQLDRESASADVERSASDAALARDIRTGVLTGTLSEQEAAEIVRRAQIAEQTTIRDRAEATRQPTIDADVAEANRRAADALFGQTQAEEGVRELVRERDLLSGDASGASLTNPYVRSEPDARAEVVTQGEDLVANITRKINAGKSGRATPKQMSEIAGDIESLSSRVVPALQAMLLRPDEAATARSIAARLVRMLPELNEDGGITVEESLGDRLSSSEFLTDVVETGTTFGLNQLLPDNLRARNLLFGDERQVQRRRAQQSGEQLVGAIEALRSIAGGS